MSDITSAAWRTLRKMVTRPQSETHFVNNVAFVKSCILVCDDLSRENFIWYAGLHH